MHAIGAPSSRSRSSVSDDICVVIPAHNEELLIGRCIDSVLAAGIPAHQIYVVDDRSTDATGDAVRAFEGINLLTNDTQLGKSGGLRRAITDFDLLSRYEYLALLDADSHVAPDYFTEVLAGFVVDPRVVLVCGAPRSERHNWLTAYRALEYGITLAAYRAGQQAAGVITVAPGCASTYRTRILNYFDWNNETLVEDMDLTVQIHRKRLGKIAYTRHAITYTQDPRRLKEYVGQLTRWYSGTWQVMRLHRVPFGGQRIDAEFALLLIEGFFYSLMTMGLPVMLWLAPASVLRIVLVDQALWMACAVIFAIQLRRGDILKSFPLFLFIRLINCGVLLSTFWLEVVRGRKRLNWFSVTRYHDSMSRNTFEEGFNA